MHALDGLRVVDLSPTRVGAQISQLFADHGADVVWIEPPGGSALRHQTAFPFWARGKRSVVVDLTTPQGQQAVRDLAASADVLVDTFRPGVLDGRGLGFDALSAANPRLVYTSVTGFGRVGPYADLQGYEGLVAAKLGFFQAFGGMTPGPRPPFVTVPWCSFSASQIALHGILAALLEREASGLGQHVETSLAQAVTALDTWSWFEYLIETKWPGAYPRVANFDDDGVPTGAFPYFLLVALTSDGQWLQFAQVAPHLFVALMKALGLAGMLTDPEWVGIPMFDDVARRSAMWSLMLEAANKRTLAEWRAIFDADPNVFAEIFRAGPAALEHPQLVFDAMVLDLVDAERGPVRQPGPLVHLAKTPAVVDRPAPTLGDDDRPAGAHGETGGAPSGRSLRDPSPPAGLPLAGVTILELAGLFAAPHGATLLTDLGARVIKVEPLAGDPIRKIIPFPESGGAKVMQGKDSICIDTSTPEGLALVHELVKTSDIVVQGYRAGVAERIGLGYERLRSLNPSLVYLNAPGYGTGGPNGHRPAYAPSIGASVGIARTNVGDQVVEETGLSLDEIRRSSKILTVGALCANAQADGFAALGVATAMLLGLLARARGAGGQEMLTTMLNTGVHAMSAQTVDYPGSPGEPRPDGEMRGLSALYQIYDASEGWVFLAAPAEHEWTRLVASLAPYDSLGSLNSLNSLNSLGSDERFATAGGRAGNDRALSEALAAIFVTRGADSWERDLRDAGVGCVAVTTTNIEAVLWSDEFGRASDYLADVEHPTFGEHPRMAPLVRFSRSATQAKPGVLAGSHTDVIMAELGHDTASIADLRARTIIA